MDRDDPGYRGQRDYNALLLAAYDPLVLGPIARFVWRCPSTRLVELYRRRVRNPHLDVGPGTGYFVEHAGLPRDSRVTIVDPNTNVLRHASRRLRALDVTAVEADVLKPLPVRERFDTAALNLVLHCLPGPAARKAAAVAHVAAALKPGGELFGASVIGASGAHTRAARMFLRAFNWQGGFDNLGDTEEGLRDILETSFDDVELEVVGSIALFAASGPRAAQAQPDRPTERSTRQ